MIPVGYSPPLPTTLEDILDHRATAVEKWHCTKATADDLRQNHLEDCIDEYAHKHEVQRESAVRQILHSKETKKLHKRKKLIMSPNDNSQLNSLLIPRPHSEDLTALMEITQPDQILQVLLRRNKRKLSAAHNGYFNYRTLYNTIGEFAEMEEAQQVIDETYDTSTVDEWTEYPHQNILKAFLQNLKRPCDCNGKKIPDMQWSYGAAEFQDTFSKKSEDMSCEPSGVTMPYYKIFCEDDDLAEFHATFI